MNAAELVKAKAGNLTIVYGEKINGIVEWKNHAVSAGTGICVGFLIGRDETAHSFELEGVAWFAGSLVVRPAPTITSVESDIVPSQVLGWPLEEILDGFAFIGQLVGDLTVLTSYDRIIGLHAAEFLANMQFLDAKWFHGLVTVVYPW